MFLRVLPSLPDSSASFFCFCILGLHFTTPKAFRPSEDCVGRSWITVHTVCLKAPSFPSLPCSEVVVVVFWRGGVPWITLPSSKQRKPLGFPSDFDSQNFSWFNDCFTDDSVLHFGFFPFFPLSSSVSFFSVFPQVLDLVQICCLVLFPWQFCVCIPSCRLFAVFNADQNLSIQLQFLLPPCPRSSLLLPTAFIFSPSYPEITYFRSLFLKNSCLPPPF